MQWMALWTLVRSETSVEKRRFTRDVEAMATGRLAQKIVATDASGRLLALLSA